MDRKEQLTAFIDAIIKSDSEAASAAFAPYVQHKSKEVLGHSTDTEEAEKVDSVVESVLKEELNDMMGDSAIRIAADDSVIVNGKKVGVVRNDATDLSGKFSFIEEGGKVTQDFSKTEDLYSFLLDRYTKGAKK